MKPEALEACKGAPNDYSERKHSPLPCPFCKGQMQKGLTKKRGCQLHGDPIQEVTLYCGNQYCRVKPSIIGGCRWRGGDKPIYEAVEREKLCNEWNLMLGVATPAEEEAA